MSEAGSNGGLFGRSLDRLLTVLPPHLLLLLAVNLVFLFVLDRRDAARERLLTPILAACLERR